MMNARKEKQLKIEFSVLVTLLNFAFPNGLVRGWLRLVPI